MKCFRKAFMLFGLGFSIATLAFLSMGGTAWAAFTHTIAADGTGCDAIGTWDGVTKTCTLDQDLNIAAGQSGIQINGNDVILDGGGFTISGGNVSGAEDGTDGVYAALVTGVKVRNLNIRHFAQGIRFYTMGNGMVTGNHVRENAHGLVLTQASNGNQVAYNTFEGNALYGVRIFTSNDNQVLWNNFLANGEPQAYIGGISSGNQFTVLSVFGNHWSSWDSPAEGCANGVQSDIFCDADYVFTGGSDTSPYIHRGAWSTFNWTWYDNIGGDSWLLFGNRMDSPTPIMVDMEIAGNEQEIGGAGAYGPGYFTPGSVVYNYFDGLRDGPASAYSRWTASEVVSSQRSLWPKGGSSLEETTGIQFFSSRFFWTWYDMLTPGYKNWVMISNPNDFEIHYSVSIGSETVTADGVVAAGGRDYKTYPGKRGGPVTVAAWDADLNPAYVMASQRVLSNNDMAFNEMPGTPADQLGADYYWPWYDMTGGASNWIMVANPSVPGAGDEYDVYYKVFIAGQEAGSGGPIPPREVEAYSSPGVQGGPVRVVTYRDAGFNTTVAAIVSQRSVWGPSFGEMPAKRWDQLKYDANWTWYDQATPGAQNWVMVINPLSDATITATVKFVDEDSGQLQSISNNLDPGQAWAPSFPGKRGGPVRVTAVYPGTSTEAVVMASQRVLWNGYFNEVWGQ